MAEKLKSEDRIILQIDPFTNEVFVQNCTRYPEAEVELSGDVGRDEEGNHVCTVTATFVFRKKK